MDSLINFSIFILNILTTLEKINNKKAYEFFDTFYSNVELQKILLFSVKLLFLYHYITLIFSIFNLNFLYSCFHN